MAANETSNQAGDHAGGWDDVPKWLMPRPQLEDREFWAGAGRGELRIQRCLSCGRHQHYARMLCSHCGKETLEWVTASGNGTVYSFTVIRQNGVPPFNERLPFVVATVDLDEDGARVIAAMPTVDPADARVGMRVRATFRPAEDEFGFVDFAAGD
jgi:uncharacterized OB-fold protein